jgi:hypothetical protein
MVWRKRWKEGHAKQVLICITKKQNIRPQKQNALSFIK